MPLKLTPKLIRKLISEENTKQIERLNLAGKDISEVGDLRSLAHLIRLDLSNNSIQDTSFADSCQHLKWLSLASNPITSLRPLQCLTNLQVLNVGHAQLTGDQDIGGLTSLGALIINDNTVTSLAGLEQLPHLNTLVAKQNAISDLGACLLACSGLQKLSMAHNALTSLGGCLRGCTQLKELRLNHNRIPALPADLAANAQLRILDLGGNPIASVAALKVLAQLPWLRSLNLRGCPVSERRDYPGTVLALLPDLDVLDNKRRADHPKAKVARGAQDAPADVVDRTEPATVSGTRQHPMQAADVRQPRAKRQGHEGGEEPPPVDKKPKDKANRVPLDPQEARGLRGETGKVAGKRRADVEEQLLASEGHPHRSSKKVRAVAGKGKGAAEAAASRSAGEQHLGVERELPLEVNPEPQGGVDAAGGQDAAGVPTPQPASALIGIYEPKPVKRGQKKKQQGSVARGAQVSEHMPDSPCSDPPSTLGTPSRGGLPMAGPFSMAQAAALLASGAATLGAVSAWSWEA